MATPRKLRRLLNLSSFQLDSSLLLPPCTRCLERAQKPRCSTEPTALHEIHLHCPRQQGWQKLNQMHEEVEGELSVLLTTELPALALRVAPETLNQPLCASTFCRKSSATYSPGIQSRTGGGLPSPSCYPIQSTDSWGSCSPQNPLGPNLPELLPASTRASCLLSPTRYLDPIKQNLLSHPLGLCALGWSQPMMAQIQPKNYFSKQFHWSVAILSD